MPPAPAHPAYQAFVEAMQQNRFKLSTVPVDKIREFINQRRPDSAPGLQQVAPIEEKVIPTNVDNGTGTIKLSIIRPVGTENEVLPVAIYLHGGGFVFGSLKSTEKFVKDVVFKAHIAIVYVEYSLSPEARFPTAVEECYSSILWVHENAASINVDASNLNVLGDSAGGHLTAVASILLKQRGQGDVIRRQVLIYPSTAFIRHNYESFKDYANDDFTLTKEDMEFFGISYFGEEKKRQVDGYWVYAPEHMTAAPLLATDDELKGLPPCLVLTAECDALRDEAEDYARRLTTVGVDTCAIRVIGAIHGFVTSTVPETPQYRQALKLICSFLNE